VESSVLLGSNLTALGALFLQLGQELPAGGAIHGDRHGLGDLRLGALQKSCSGTADGVAWWGGSSRWVRPVMARLINASRPCSLVSVGMGPGERIAWSPV